MTGVVIDRSTERCIEKKWAGIPMDTFMLVKGIPLNYEEDELLLPSESEVQQKGQPGAKGKTAPKKDEKKPNPKDQDKGKKPPTPDVVVQGSAPKTREVPSFKTFRQKTCYQNRNKALDEYSKYFTQTTQYITHKFDSLKENEHKYQFQWERSIDQIFYKA